MRTLPVGPDAVLVEVAGPGEAAALALRVRELAPTYGVRVADVVPAAASVLLDGLADVSDHAGLRDLLAALDAEPTGEPTGDSTGETTGGPRTPGDVVELEVRWGGPDLAFVTRHWRLDESAVVERLEGAELVSAFCGFAPGFAYLAGLPELPGVPRLADPRPRVAPGSVALADRWCGVYPTASPGGWRLVGRTDARLWDPDRPAPALLAPGTRVRLVGA